MHLRHTIRQWAVLRCAAWSKGRAGSKAALSARSDLAPESRCGSTWKKSMKAGRGAKRDSTSTRMTSPSALRMAGKPIGAAAGVCFVDSDVYALPSRYCADVNDFLSGSRHRDAGPRDTVMRPSGLSCDSRRPPVQHQSNHGAEPFVGPDADMSGRLASLHPDERRCFWECFRPLVLQRPASRWQPILRCRRLQGGHLDVACVLEGKMRW